MKIRRTSVRVRAATGLGTPGANNPGTGASGPISSRPRSARSIALVVVGALVLAVLTFVAPAGPADAQTSSAAGEYVPLSPVRIRDTRTGGGPVAANGTMDVQVGGQGGVP
ncbi:MAG TPA: hypothetical protein VF711_09005, partial [Acidimicrobiales bacterium]